MSRPKVHSQETPCFAIKTVEKRRSKCWRDGLGHWRLVAKCIHLESIGPRTTSVGGTRPPEIPSGKRLHNYGKITFFLRENQLLNYGHVLSAPMHQSVKERHTKQRLNWKTRPNQAKTKTDQTKQTPQPKTPPPKDAFASSEMTVFTRWNICCTASWQVRLRYPEGVQSKKELALKTNSSLQVSWWYKKM